jgi:hypothetical protein
MPESPHSLGYMEIDVKPGIVLTSLADHDSFFLFTGLQVIGYCERVGAFLDWLQLLINGHDSSPY